MVKLATKYATTLVRYSDSTLYRWRSRSDAYSVRLITITAGGTLLRKAK